MFRWIEHTAELELEIEGASEEGVFEYAFAAMCELVGEPGGGEVLRENVGATASDYATLLADWLMELVFLVETRDLVPVRLETLRLEEGRVSATVEGRRGSPRHLVKGVTYHRLTFDRADGGWRATVVLDV
jgi:SHS2 domain-containing protein